MNKNFSQTLLDLIKYRRSVRIFNGKKISREDILSIIEAGIWAPTGCNNQELRFLILDEEKEINKFIKFKPFLRGVSAVVLVFCDMSLPMSRKIYCRDKSEKHLCYIDTGLALGNMILYAKSKGIGSCIVNLSKYHLGQSETASFIKKLTNKIKLKLNLYTLMENNFEFYLRNSLKIPDHLKIMCGVVFGYTDKYPDVNTEMHGGKRIMRERVDYYIIHKNDW